MAEDTDAAAGVSPADREDLVAYARRMAPDDLAPGTAGNLSVRRGELMAITPSGMPYERMTPADICLVRTSDAALLSGPRPSTETPMHLAMYQASGATAIVHTHSPFVVALSTGLPASSGSPYAMADLGGPVRVALYQVRHRPARGQRGHRAGRAQRGDPAQPPCTHLWANPGPRLRAGPHPGVAGQGVLVRAAGGHPANARRERAYRGQRRGTGASLRRNRGPRRSRARRAGVVTGIGQLPEAHA